ncbi:ROK family transcriptional regulator [Fusibacter ferrireducens]|uniref:ROK family transcriptional regulator n=1 Tax=Fusibacter ferrireducens TaxID=2785058 RepID=A0ABR9ZNX6_9FIRM|nr:ROK family transcriptional regulator [Fusibacter ferrireducens]MBF4692162.1 ROK family transcriptional regulator [Fusibacter ferrireducens]
MSYTIADRQLIKKLNTNSILKVVLEKGTISRADIAKILNLTPATVSSNINNLIQDGIVHEVGIGTSSGGRKPVMIELNENGKLFIGVDIHKDGVEAAIVNLAGKILARSERQFSDHGNKFEDDVVTCIDDVRELLPDLKLDGIGIGMHGIVDTNQNISVYAPAMSRRNIALKDYIEKKESLPVFIDNDANAMAIGESWFGQAKGVRNYIFLNVGRGIGSGIVINGELFHGNRYAAGEIGHIRVVESGMRCVCGKYGCLDTVATEYSIIKTIINSIHTGVSSSITELSKGDLSTIDLNMLKEAAQLGDKCVLEALDKMGRYIGVAVSYAINMMNPGMIVFGGSMSVLGEYIIESIRSTAINLSLEECADGVFIVISSLRDNAGVVGAASLGMQNLFKE